jgi:hypothetical protein
MKKKFIIWFMSTKLYWDLITKVIPFIRFSMYYTKLRGDKYHEGYSYLKKGYMIGTIDYRKLTGLLIPKVTGGILSHAAYCVAKRDPKQFDILYSQINPLDGHGSGLEVAEMTHLDFTFSDFFDICKESDRVVIFKCLDWDELFIEKLTQKILSFRKSKYDPAFQLDGPELAFLYCSEMIYQGDKIANGGIPRIKADISDLMNLGRPYVSPDGLLCSENVEVVWDSHNELTGMSGIEVKKHIYKGK